VDVVLYSVAILVELAALVVLRIKEPDLPRPFRIPGGFPVLGAIVLAPLGIVIFSVVNHVREEGQHVILWSFIALCLGPIFTWIAQRTRRPQRDPES